MLSLSKLQDQIYEALNVTSDDTGISSRLITDLINQQRSLWLRNEYNKNRQIHDNVTQDLGCVEIELADRASCCNITLDCDILRTKNTIPDPIEFFNSDGIRRVGPIDRMARPYSYITYPQAIFSGNGRYNRKEVFAFLLNRRIHLTSYEADYKFIKYINIRGVFEDPTAAATFTTCTGQLCWTSDSIYPVTEWMWEYIKPQVIKQLAEKLSVPADLENNAKDDISGSK